METIFQNLTNSYWFFLKWLENLLQPVFKDYFRRGLIALLVGSSVCIVILIICLIIGYLQRRSSKNK